MDGVVRVVAAAAQNGVGTIESGKRELSFQAYEKLQQWFLEERSHEGVFARAFLSLTWNLMCRGVNTCVCLKHFVWKDDCFGLSFSHVKNDQDGSRNFHPRHIYANPDNYLLCCVTAVFEYLLCFPGLFKDEHTMLFLDQVKKSDSARFSKGSLISTRKNCLLWDMSQATLESIPYEKARVPTPRAALRRPQALRQSTIVVAGHLEVHVMCTCCMNVLVISMLGAYLVG